MRAKRPDNLGVEHSRPWDRLLALGVALMVLAPFVAYAWVAYDAERQTRIETALDRNLSTAQLAAGRLDEQCARIMAALSEAARHRDLAVILRRGDSGQARVRLSDLRRTLPDVDLLLAFGFDGSPVASNTPPGHSHAIVREMQRLRRYVRRREKPFARVVHNEQAAVFLLMSPARDVQGVAGGLAAIMAADRVEKWLQNTSLAGGVVYIANHERLTIASSRPVRFRWLPLDQYEPMQQALAGQTGKTIAPSPEGLDPDMLIGFAPARVPSCGVIAAQPMTAAFAPSDFLMRRLAVLLLPVAFLAFAWVWFSERYARQSRALAAALTAQNEALRAADRTRSDFLANVSHDLRTPLAAMRAALTGMLDLKVRWTPGQMHEALQTLERETEQMAARVRNLLDMARLEAGADTPYMEPADLTDILSSALERTKPLLQARKVHCDFPPEPLLTECDQTQVETVLVNLLENAAKYSPEGTPLHIRGEAVNGSVAVLVRDEGAGLEPGEELRIFEKFYRSPRARRQARGTGLGLAICKTIAEAHRGGIEARNVPEGGAEFRLWLPALNGAEEQGEERHG